MEHMLVGLALLTVIVLLVMGLEMIRSRHLKREMDKMEVLKEQSQKYYEQIQQNNIDINKLSETLERQKEVIENLLTEEQNRNTNRDGIVSYTGNALLDVILSRKRRLAEENNIDFKIEAECVSALPCEEHEIVSLFENLLDNAIEACVMVRQQGNPFISMQIKRIMNGDVGYSIYIENSKNKELHPVETHFVTSKEDKENHGNGVAIIQSIVEKYQGEIKFFDKGESFLVTICM